MTKGKIEAEKEDLKAIFSQKFWFVVPEYQRSYVWETENVIELVEDLTYAFENKVDNEYFLGSLVLKRLSEKAYPEFEVLDGQQRLTTFFIMLSVLRDLVQDNQSKLIIHKKIFQEENRLENIPERARITYRIRDNVEDFIKDFILTKGGTEKIEKLKDFGDGDNISLSHMANATLVLNDFFKNMQQEKLEKFIQFIFNKAIFIYVSTENTEDAFRMFMILNDRGVPLTNADILKSQNIGVLDTEKEIRKYALLWEEIEGKHGEQFDRFLQFIRMILSKEKARMNLVDEYSKIYDKGLLQEGISTFELIEAYNECYESIIDLQDLKLDNDFKNLVTIMKIGLRSEDWIPPLLFYFRKFKYENLMPFLKKLEYKFTADWVCGNSPTSRIESMTNIIKKIESANNTDEILYDMSLYDIDLEALSTALDGNIYKRRYARYILLKLEYLMYDNTVHLSNYDYITSEHILPQNPKEGSQWKKDFDEDNREKWTHKVANLVLISRMKNSRLSNLDFKEKKKRYLASRIDAFHGTKIFIDANDKWIPELLEERQKKLVKAFIENN